MAAVNEERADDEGWETVCPRRNRQKLYSEDIEFGVEYKPSYAFGLLPIINKFGVDTSSEIVKDAYTAPHLLQGTTRLARTNRKVQSNVALGEGGGSTGFVNVCPNFVHSSLAFVNPPANMGFEEASSYIRKKIRVELSSVANMDPPELTFSPEVHEGVGKGHRSMFRISSSAASLQEKQFVASVRNSLRGVFEAHGFRVRFPREPHDEIHITIRDERYETKSARVFSRQRPVLPHPKGNFKVTFDKLAVTPAAESDARHSFAKSYCGSTLCLNMFVEMSSILARAKCFVEGNYFPCPDGSLTPIDELQPHMILLGEDGRHIEVLSVHKHETEERDLMYLEAESDLSGMIVTADHRVVVPRRGARSTMPAGNLRKGSSIITAAGERTLSSADLLRTLACVYEVKLEDDAPILTYFDGALLTKGAHDPQVIIRSGGRGGTKRKKRLHKRLPTVPDTDYDGDHAFELRLNDML